MEIEKIFKGIGGWLTYNEGVFLLEMAKIVRKEDVIVEVGSWKGRSTACLGKGSRGGNQIKIFAIDPHSEGTYNQFLKNLSLAEVDDLVNPIVKTSEADSKDFNNSIGFLF